MVNAAARHHKPDTYLQWLVATADRVASGFEREEFARYNDARDKSETGRNHYTARQLTLFEPIRLEGASPTNRDQWHYRYPLRPLSPAALFPVLAAGYESNDDSAAQAEYRALWDQFTAALGQIPASHRGNWSLWLDHFDAAWACYTQAIPAATAFGVRPEVSLYDHSHTAAALAAAFWRYHHDRGDDPAAVRQRLADYHRPDWDEQKLLLIQGDFFGIQDFIFATGGETQRRAAKLLRGRSFYVSLLTECAALRLLDGLALPPHQPGHQRPPVNSSSSPPTPRRRCVCCKRPRPSSTPGSWNIPLASPVSAWPGYPPPATTFCIKARARRPSPA
jgi:CRISPR-associated protein Csm1